MSFTSSLLVSFLVLLLYPVYELFSSWLTNELRKETLTVTTICIPTVKRETFYLAQVIYSFFQLCQRYPRVAQDIHRVFIFQLDDHDLNPYWNEDLTIPFHCRKKIFIQLLPQCFPAIENKTYYEWRCKEAIDYARTMENCEKLANPSTTFFLLLQDDAVFNSHFPSFYEALPGWMERSKWRRVCSISLYDIKQRTDGGPLLSYNAVARLYPRNLMNNMSAFIKRQFQKQPVDWLIEEYCRKLHLTTFVKVPNPVRHIGNISTFKTFAKAARRLGQYDSSLGKLCLQEMNKLKRVLGRKIRVKCNPDDTIGIVHKLYIYICEEEDERFPLGDLKKLIAAQTGTRPEKIRIQKWYTVYKDHISLADYEIHDGMGLELYYD